MNANVAICLDYYWESASVGYHRTSSMKIKPVQPLKCWILCVPGSDYLHWCSHDRVIRVTYEQFNCLVLNDATIQHIQGQNSLPLSTVNETFLK